jgi:hypothetical protein
MANIALISCVSKKLLQKAKAREIYISTLFKLSLKYAEMKYSRIYILSAKYGLLELEQEIDTYNETLNDKSKKERLEWAEKVMNQIKTKCDIQMDEFVFLAGRKYYENLIPNLPNNKILMGNLSIGKRLQWLKEELNE